MNDKISLRSSKNPSFVTIKQKVNFTNESIIHANTEKYTKFCAIKATNHQSLVTKEFKKKDFLTVFENHRKSRIQHCERSELRLHVILIGQKLVENANI